jgi:phosphatidylinositol-3-phosphatase
MVSFRSCTSRAQSVLAAAAAGLLGVVVLLQPWGAGARAASLALCGNPGSAPTPIQHVLVVVLENKSYGQVLGRSAYPTSSMLAATCGTATRAFGATHTSAANYLALVSGTVSHYSGCGTVSACTALGQTNLFSQLDAAGLTWKSYEEDMPAPCGPTSNATTYKIGHNPALFYKLADCKANDVPVADLTAPTGAFAEDLADQTLPTFGFITPSLVDDGEGPGGYPAADRWLGRFVALVQASPAYQAGNTMLIVTNDEGSGADAVNAEDCTNRSRDLAGNQESCHIPFFIVYPWASGKDATFFTHYSVTRTVQDLFGLTPMAGSITAQTLVGHFGIALPATGSPTPTSSSSPAAES